MPTLLQRMSIDQDESVGPSRTKTRRVSSGPYERPTATGSRPPKGDVNSTWEHDLFAAPANGSAKSLSARLGVATQSAPPKMNFGGAQRALYEAVGGLTKDQQLSIRGASTRRNVVEVTGLVKDTTAEDVQAIFKRCGPIIAATATASPSGKDAGEVTVRLTFKFEKDAKDAVDQFHNMVADGRTLSVRVVGGVNAGLTGRMNVGPIDGSVDALIGNGTSKMRSDDILQNDAEARSRAHVLVAPPGADPKDYTQAPRSGRGRGRGRRGGGGGGRRGRGAARMDVD